jgi:hypothetical protein
MVVAGFLPPTRMVAVRQNGGGGKVGTKAVVMGTKEGQEAALDARFSGRQSRFGRWMQEEADRAVS